MVQEIITYIIIGAAVALAILKTVKKLKGKNPHSKKTNFQKDSFSMQHNCSDCSAECMLRNEVKSIKEKNKDLCAKIELHQT